MNLQPQINSARIVPMETMQRVGVVHLTNGRFTVVDPERVDEFSKFKWRRGTGGYVVAYRSGPRGQPMLRLHRVVMAAKDGVEVDHKYGDKLDNRFDSLRIATPSQNSANSPKREGAFSSKYKGVDRHVGAWRAAIRINGNKRHLGRFQDEVEAARVYNAAALEHYGEFARINALP